MELLIAAAGKRRAGPEATLVDEYLKRARGAGRNIGFSGPTVVEVEAPGNLEMKKRQAREGAQLLASIRGGARIIALDENGDNMSSETFADMLARLRDQGAPGAAFLIGGADGHAEEIKRRADRTISFGAATWPHMLVRVMLAEQIYRAMTILMGHPYHRS